MRGYALLITTKTVDDYINGCLELFLKNNWKIIFIFTIFSYICECQIDNTNQINIEMAKDTRVKSRRAKPLIGNSGYTRNKRKYELGGQHDRVVNGVHYHDRVKSGVR